MKFDKRQDERVEVTLATPVEVAMREFKRRMDQLDREHEARIARMNRNDRRFKWAFGLVVVGYVIAEILLAVLR